MIGGPGSQFAHVASRLGLLERGVGPARSRIRTADQQGASWVDANRVLILRWLEDECYWRKIQFDTAKAERLISIAVDRSRKHGWPDAPPLTRTPCKAGRPVRQSPLGGPGTELTKLLAWFIHTPENCRCKSRAALMDRYGVDWCERHEDLILSWLAEAHAEQRTAIPFIPVAVRGVIKVALHRARINANTTYVTPDNQQVVVINCNRHGYGDATVCAWIAEGSREAPVRMGLHATGGRAEFLHMLGIEVAPRMRGMLNTFAAYSAELRQKGEPPRVWQRGGYFGITTEPKRPRHDLTVEELDWARHAISRKAVLLWPNTEHGNREWPPFYWLELANILKEAGYDVHMCGGPKVDVRYAQWPGIWGYSWRQNAALMLASRLVIGNDSGPAHLAGTLDAPTLALLGPTAPSVFVQYPSVECLSANRSDIECVNCYFQGQWWGPKCHHGCVALSHLEPRTVADRALAILAENET